MDAETTLVGWLWVESFGRGVFLRRCSETNLLEAECMEREKLVRPERFELPTYSSGGCRSIQLSYGRVVL
jgi:hypothetical protein